MLNDGTIEHSNFKAIDMATKSCLLFISLTVIIANAVSADRLHVVDRNRASEGIGVPQPDVNVVSADRLHVMDRNRASEGLGVHQTDANAVSADRPHKVDRNPASEGLGVSKKDTNVNMMSKMGSAGKMNNNGNGMNAVVSPVVPVPMPGADGQFQFQIGPIGFGWNWNFGGGVPGPLITYSQPIVVSPYSTPSGLPFPYIGVMPSPGAYQPLPGYSGFYPGGYHRHPFGRYGPNPSGQHAQGANQMQHPTSGHD
ncbi:uncharacterized protein LOC141596577 [Silene latifolia]|uniref:uncharacterized protein LOC141596577 n=1 Tax=Silene latifolia TaxID=37657 RepID=UPI003D76C488